MNRFVRVYEDPEYDEYEDDVEYVYPDSKSFEDMYFDIEDTGIELADF